MKYLKKYESSHQVDLSYDNLNALPPIHPETRILTVNDNRLHTLPELPDGMIKIDCRNNIITVLPKLPKDLIRLFCGDNKLTKLPELPEKLVLLYCSNNLLTELPELPDSLQGLNCANNKWSKPIKLRYFDLSIDYVYTKEQFDLFSSYEFQKEFLSEDENKIKEKLEDLTPFGIHPDIEKDFSWYFEGGEMGLL